VGEHTRFAYLGLEEPPKDEVLAFRPGDPVERRARAILLDTATGEARDVVVMVSADVTPWHRERLLEAGAVEYLTEPLDVSGSWA
jgi:primary-amine oxidase